MYCNIGYMGKHQNNKYTDLHNTSYTVITVCNLTPKCYEYGMKVNTKI